MKSNQLRKLGEMYCSEDFIASLNIEGSTETEKHPIRISLAVDKKILDKMTPRDKLIFNNMLQEDFRTLLTISSKMVRTILNTKQLMESGTNGV